MVRRLTHASAARVAANVPSVVNEILPSFIIIISLDFTGSPIVPKKRAKTLLKNPHAFSSQVAPNLLG